MWPGARGAEAAYTLANPDILWIATNTDQSIPKERGQAPGNGTLVAAVASATRRTPLVAGKPEAPIFHTAAKAVNSSRPVIVGDRLDTDILGANNAKMDGALVLTGVQTYQDVIEAVPNQRPTYILRTLEDFFAPYPEIEVLYEGYEVTATGPTWQARVRGENLSLTGPEIEDTEAFAGSESEAEAWRVACAAWWAANPEQGARPNIQGIPGA